MSKSKVIDVTIPSLGESIFEVQISAWLKQPGQTVALDEPVLEIESDKATVEVPAPAAGVLAEVLKAAGEMAAAGEVVARIASAGVGKAGGTGAPASSTPAPAAAPVPAAVAASAAAPVPAAAPTDEARVMPAARRILQEKGVDPATITGTGPGGRILKPDAAAAVVAAEAAAVQPADVQPGSATGPSASPAPAPGERTQRIVPMTMIRRRIAERLVQSQQNAALLTTFNEIDMSRVIALRKQHQEAFLAKYGAKLGFMSFFVRAAVEALQMVPQLNAEIHGQDIVYHDYQDVGIAIGGGKGLVVPVLRNAEALDFGQIEQAIADLADRAGRNKLDLEELQGGTFTISNGGIYGSLMSTPIINPPQSGVLGLHAIQDRPVAMAGQVVIRPMMYVALTYDHRIVDGREAVTFLMHVKHCVEQPERLLLKV